MQTAHNRIANAFYSLWLPRKMGGTVFDHLNWFKANEARDRSEIERVKQSLLTRLLLHAQENVPYYRRVFAEQGISPAQLQNLEILKDIPLLTRAQLQDNLETLVTENVERRLMIRDTTGGSTGKPTPFYHDRGYKLHNDALILRNMAWTGWRFGEPVVKIWGSGFDYRLQMRLKERVLDFLRNETIFPAYEMTPANMSRWVKKIQSIRPTVVVGYASALAALAEWGLANDAALDGLGVKAVLSSAEMLLPSQRELLEVAFCCRVFDRYGTRELSTVAQDCRFGRLHVNEDWLHLEIVDDRGDPLPPGNLGQVVLTGYFTLGMPFIRYAIEDVAAFPAKDEPCPCGCPFRALERLEGRVQGLISLPGGGVMSGVFFPQLFRQFDVRQFQVVQPTLDRLEVSLVVGPRFDGQAMENIRSTLAKHASGVTASFRMVDHIPPAPSGKFRFTVSHVTQADVFRQTQTN